MKDNYFNSLARIVLGGVLAVSPFVSNGCSSNLLELATGIKEDEPRASRVLESEKLYDFGYFYRVLGEQAKNISEGLMPYSKSKWELFSEEEREKICSLYKNPNKAYKEYYATGSFGKKYVDNFEKNLSKKEIKQETFEFPWINPDRVSLADKMFLHSIGFAREAGRR